jgi:molybdopterin-guanine dinucleotide biosynthesis protein A
LRSFVAYSRLNIAKLSGVFSGERATMIGVVLAGGAGRRIGGAKPGRLLAGRPLVSYPAAALAAVCDRVAIVAKRGTELPRLPGVEIWDDEPAEPQHPLTGIVHALERAAGEPILVCAADMPFVTPEALRSVMEPGETAVGVADGVLQPTLAYYDPTALTSLSSAAPGIPLTRAVEALDPVRVELPQRTVRNVNTPEELAAAEAELSGAP